jgi:radical SAM superfamily enzyme YgiQ (UPF0313 family)
MMKQSFNAAICVLNSKYIHSSLAPWCLLAGVNAYCENGISAEVIEGTINEKIEQVAERVIAQSPQVIGFSCYIWNIAATKQLIRLVKSELPDTVIILGGPEVSYNAEEVLREEPMVQYVISGEGEKPFALLLNAIRHGETAQDIPGVCYRSGGQIIVAPPYITEEEPPSPYTQAYFDALKGRIAYLETSRGCPFGCAFCLSGRCGSARFFNLERSKKELLLLANSGTQTVKLVDRTFNANRKRAIELYRFIIENYGEAIPKGVCFHFEIAGDLLDEETIDLLATAPVGAMQLEIGLQSFNSKTLAAINRKTNVERLKQNIERVVANANMHIHIDLIAGLPYEDLNSFAESFNIAYALKPNMLQLGFLKLLYGAPMREKPEEFPCSYSQNPPYEVTQTPWLSPEELLRLHHTEDALERLSNSGRFRRTLEYLLKQSGQTPFALFSGFGEYAAVKGTEKIPLDGYTALVFEYFSVQKGIDKVVLRDMMACDRLSTNSSGKLPNVLRIRDTALKSAVNELEGNEATRSIKGIKRGSALLYSEHCAVYVDYQDKNPINGEFSLHKVHLGMPV